MKLTKELIMKEISEKLEVELETLNDEMSFKNDLGADSIDLYQILIEMEDEYGVEIDDDEAAKIVTIKDLCDAVL